MNRPTTWLTNGNGPTMTSNLPANVSAVRDRHGKIRYRFRRRGFSSAYLPGTPATAEFHAAYAKILEGGPKEPVPVRSTRQIAPKSLDDLHRRMKSTNRWKKKAASTQRVQSRIMERFLDRTSKSGSRYGDRPVDKVSVAWLEAIFGAMWETPAAANVLRRVLSTHLALAVRYGWIVENPVRYTDKYEEGEGFHTITDDEIERFRARHPLGSMARLTLELALNTAGRRCNLNKIERDHIANGRIYVDHAKDNHDTSVPMLATTKAAIDALPAAPIRFLITTVFGKPFTDAGLGNKARDWFDQAGLPHCSLHGLRKAISRQLAEGGASDAEGQAVTGHKKSETFASYRAKANRSRLADRALSNLGPLAVVQPVENANESND